MDDARRRELMRAGLRAFDRRQFYDAHEHWEEVWNELDDPERRWVQGLIQLATGLHKLERQLYLPARTLVDKAVAKLAGAPDLLDGVDVAAARRAATALAAALGRGDHPPVPALSLAPADDHHGDG